MKALARVGSLVLLVLLGACNEATPGVEPASAARPAVSLEAIQSKAQGFSVGPSMSRHTVYVFFDAQCPHCAQLWDAAKPLRNQVRFVWVPVGLINAASTSQGAALLAAADPVAAMDVHETSMRERQGGITATGVAQDKKDAVAANSQLFNASGFASVPTLVAKHSQSGALITQEGALSTAALTNWLGLRQP